MAAGFIEFGDNSAVDDLALLGNVLALLTEARQHLLRQCSQLRHVQRAQILSINLSFELPLAGACLQACAYRAGCAGRRSQCACSRAN